MFEIRLAHKGDIDLLIEHKARHMKEPGFEGKLAHPFKFDHEFDWEARKIETLLAMDRAVGDERWLRHFILIIDGVIVGEVNLKNLFDATLHRAQLGMGLEASARGLGHGKKLLSFALRWARDQESLDWVDLSYFSHNLPAKKLYDSVGFQELFVYQDRLRVGDQSIDDVYMTLKLK